MRCANPRPRRQTYAFYGFMHNEFDRTSGWGCPCSAQPGGCSAAMGGAACRMTGEDVLRYWDVPDWVRAACALHCEAAPAMSGGLLAPMLLVASHCETAKCCLSADSFHWVAAYDSQNKWYVSLVVLAAWAVFYRSVFYFTCTIKEKWARA